ncbi:MAG: Hpt domain-containing protein [Gemmatimonadetes bacterium]|nr:Hpt domain-containing protein [Gemmatimonadota bacterium]
MATGYSIGDLGRKRLFFTSHWLDHFTADCHAPSMTAPPLDKTAFLARLHGDTELGAGMAALFLRDYPGQLESLRGAVAAGDADQIERFAHLLSGAVGNFAAAEATDAAARLVRIARSGDLTLAADALVALDTALQRLAPALRNLTV